jgi:hypothetical protein
VLRNKVVMLFADGSFKALNCYIFCNSSKSFKEQACENKELSMIHL